MPLDSRRVIGSYTSAVRGGEAQGPDAAGVRRPGSSRRRARPCVARPRDLRHGEICLLRVP